MFKNLFDFWDSTSSIGPELSSVAIQIYRIYVNSASVEQLWSNMRFLHTTYRSRLQ
ncbi:22007_t:CDS:2, partial [Dentiscutata erythropus]